MSNITPRIDLAFKKIFGVEGNEDLLISLVNAVLDPKDQVTGVTLLNPYNLQSFKKDKLSVLDIKAETIDGRRINVEIQITDVANYDKRALYYWAKLYTEQLQSGDGYDRLYKAIGIHILNFVSVNQSERYHNVFDIREKTDNFAYFTNLELHTIELPKFKAGACEELSALVSQVKDALDMWMAFLTRHNLLNHETLPASLNNPALKKALHVLDVMNLSPEEREAYEGRLKWHLTEQDTLLKQFQKGREEERIEIARNMLKRQMDPNAIAEMTGLSEEVIKGLQ